MDNMSTEFYTENTLKYPLKSNKMKFFRNNTLKLIRYGRVNYFNPKSEALLEN